MASNYTYQEPGGAIRTFEAPETGGVLRPIHDIGSLPADPLGANADAAVVTDTSGTISGKLRGLVKWAFERMPASLGGKTTANSLPVTLPTDGALPSTLSTANSSTSVLGAASAFTGTGEDVSKYRSISVFVYASHASATNGLSIQFSTDNSNWDLAKTFTVSAATPDYYSIPVYARYFRIVYTNGGTLQTSFRLQTLLHPTLVGVPSFFPPQQIGLPVSHNKSVKNASGTTSSTATIVAAVTGKKIKVVSYSIISNSTGVVTVKFNSGASGTEKWGVVLQAPSGAIAGANLSTQRPDCLFETAAGSLLELELSSAVAVRYAISYFDDDAV